MVLGVHMCFVMVIFVFVLFFFLVRDPFILAHAIGALLYLCIYWSVQHKKKKKKKKKKKELNSKSYLPTYLCSLITPAAHTT